MGSSEKNNTFSQALADIMQPIFKKVLKSYLIPEIKSILEKQDHPQYYTSKDVREQFGLSSQFLHSYREDGLIEYVQIGRKIIYPYEEIQRFVNEHNNPKKQ